MWTLHVCDMASFSTRIYELQVSIAPQFRYTPTTDSTEPPSAEDPFVEPLWDKVFNGSPGLQKLNGVYKCHLLFSLIIFLRLNVRGCVLFLFESTITQVRHRAGFQFFLTYSKDTSTAEEYGPARLYTAWCDASPKSRPHLHSHIVSPCAQEIVLKEFDSFISEKKYKLSRSDCTVDNIIEVLDLGRLAGEYQEAVLFTWPPLSTFTASPNCYREYNKKLSVGTTRENIESFDGDDEEI